MKFALALVLLAPGINCRRNFAARETTAQDLIGNIEMACKIYERDWGAFPPMDPAGFESGPCVAALSWLNKKKQPYIEFMPVDVATWPISPSSHLRNPVRPGATIKYCGPGAHKRNSVDLWCEDGQGNPSGINNWNAETNRPRRR